MKWRTKAVAMDILSEKHNIKNLLFTRAIPNYVIPVPTHGYKLFACTDCRDKFIFESSYNDHVNRKSVKISYMCRHCCQLVVFYNRCNLLCHIRSHVFKTATINVTDLKVEPLPMSAFQIGGTKVVAAPQLPEASAFVPCYECDLNVNATGIPFKDRALHLMQFSNEVYSCPVCLFALPTICSLEAHLRLHTKCPPYYCPECGLQMALKNIKYPYSHDCDGFKMMRATARTMCVIDETHIFHPNDFKEHMKEYHLKKVFKCPYCVVACFNEKTMQKHLINHTIRANSKLLIFYQCEACPGRFVMHNHVDQHLKHHVPGPVFPCWACGIHFKDVVALLKHFDKEHCCDKQQVQQAITRTLDRINANKKTANRAPRIYRVVKRCGQCKRNFIYKCKREDIKTLPCECPYKCAPPLQSVETDSSPIDDNSQITCHLCQNLISQEWRDVKKHYAEHHKGFQCLDAKILVTKIDISKYLPQNKNKKKNITISKKRKARRVQLKKPLTPIPEPELILVTPTITNSDFCCNVCGKDFENKELLEGHIKSHRDPCMAYQCIECAQSFVVKPSFSKHLLLEHGIEDTEEYINSKQCYNETALLKYQDSNVMSNEPVGKNQCSICREQFNDSTDLEKHFRVHGMAFLKTRKICNV